MVEDFERLQLWFSEIRQKIRYRNLKFIEDVFIKKVNNSSFQIFCLGGFDEKICIAYSKTKFSTLICSVDKNFFDTLFYKKYFRKFKNIKKCENKFSIICDLDPEFIRKLCNPKVALLSLAKNDVYTFPRFALGISDIAHAIRNNFQGSVTLHDLQLNPDIDDFVNSARVSKADIIGISMTFGLFDVLEKVLAAIRKANLNCLVAVGGSLAGLTYKEILTKYPNVVVSLGEGELFFVKFIEYFNGKITLKNIPDIAYVDEDKKIIATTQSRFCRNIDLSIPELDLLIPTIKAKGVFQIETSRGCYNSCTFCPRKQKGIWRGSIKDIERVDILINHFCEILKNNGYDPSKYIVYVVDEEFVGGESPLYQNRAVRISEIFAKYSLKYETSFRMNTIFSSHLPYAKKLEKINSVKQLRDNGLNRTLVGVESGVQSILERFNKNVTSTENITGIRLLTGLNVPIRFTYITFDPLMNFEELKETYFFQGRTDLILNDTYKNDAEKLLALVQDNDKVQQISKNIPFYSSIPYMLVSIECLIGSKYLDIAFQKKLTTNNVVTALGKQEVHYLDKRIEKMSKYCQLWIDRNFAIDYSLKSLSKIYSGNLSLNIRRQRIMLKDHAYALLGKMLYVIEPNPEFLKNCSEEEYQFVKNLRRGVSVTFENLDGTFKKLLNHQFELLTKQVFVLKENLKSNLSVEDFGRISTQIDKWKKAKTWNLIHKN